jgi:hypothetical protein
MADDLRETMIQAAAARYGQEHYRALLFWRGMRKVWPLLLLVIGVGLAGWALKPAVHAASAHGAAALPWVGGGLVLAMAAFLAYRRLRSPYRRRRFR